MELTAYLHFDGQCQEAFKAYERIFRGTILMMLSYADVPASDNCAPGSADRIMHARLQADRNC